MTKSLYIHAISHSKVAIIPKKVSKWFRRNCDDVYARVRDAIVDGTLAPEEQLRDADIAAWLGVSRTPVREALIRLASEGLVTLMPNRGARVTPLELTDVPQLLEALELHHRTVMRFAARRRSAAERSCELPRGAARCRRRAPPDQPRFR